MMFKYILIAAITISTLGNIALIGDERKPITKGSAIVNLIINASFIIGILYNF